MNVVIELVLALCACLAMSPVRGCISQSLLPALGSPGLREQGSSLDLTLTWGLDMEDSCEYPGSQGKTKESQRTGPKEARRCLAPHE